MHETNPANGLVADKTQPDAPASIVAVGFALAVYPVGVERSWIARADAAERTLATDAALPLPRHGVAAGGIYERLAMRKTDL